MSMEPQDDSQIEKITTTPTDGSCNKKAQTQALPQNEEKDENPDGDIAGLEHLSDAEAAIIKRQVAVIDAEVGIATLYRYASKKILGIVFASCFMAVASGVAIPLMVVVFGNLQGKFTNYFMGDLSYDEFKTELVKYVVYFVYLAVASFVTTYVSTVGFIYTGEQVTSKIRTAYLESLLYQNVAFFDHSGTGEVISRITTNMVMIQEGISDKVGHTITGISTFIAAFIVGFVQYWKLTLILVSSIVTITLIMGVGSSLALKYGKSSIEAYGAGASIVDETFRSIRNTVAFGAQGRIVSKYDNHLKNSEAAGIGSRASVAFILAGLMLVGNLSYGLAFWLGGRYVIYEDLPLQKVLITVLVIVLGAFNFGNVAHNAQSFTTALAAAKAIYTVIDRQSPLDSSKEAGVTLDHLEGSMRLECVKHVYPSRPDVLILDNVSLDLPAGKTTALVGPSGSGKSTVVGLIERFYEPLSGVISLDGHDIRDLNLRWLRQQISLVSQEPVLFGTTIFENIKYGLVGSQSWNDTIETLKELVINAAKTANAHDFISALPEGYETNVGTGGFLLSGGQKQRIAIARAIVSNPKILLLDEATSALDAKSEEAVQRALDAAARDRTTVVIAHRLSTIRYADNIIFMSDKRIIEQGTHDELLQKQGAYAVLVNAQSIASKEDAAKDNHNSITDAVTNETGAQNPKEEDITEGCNMTAGNRRPSMASSGLATDSQPIPDSPRPRAYSTWTLTKRIASFNSNEKWYMLIGILFSIVCGAGTPVQSIFLAKAISTLSTPLTSTNRGGVKKESDFWAAMYLMLGGAVFIGYIVHGLLFAKCSERLIRRARKAAFQSMLRQDVSYFDNDKNTAGVLSMFLAIKANDLAGLSGVTLGNILVVMTTVVVGIVVAIAIGWKLALVCTSTVPVLIACGYFRLRTLSHFGRISREMHAESAGYASEAVSAMRTVVSLTLEPNVLHQYTASLSKQRRVSLTSIHRASILYAASEALTYLIFALCFWYGGTLIATREYSIFQFFACFSCVVFSAQSAGAFFSHSANIGKAYIAADEFETLFNRKPTIDTWSSEGRTEGNIQGAITLRNVAFTYPTRPNQPILRGINFQIQPGQYIALVGGSGCGKSTIISLLERFYNPSAGSILLDEEDISSLNVNFYRSQLAIVSQEPILYQGTIRENILLGAPDGVLPDGEMERACREADIFEFISSLPDGFETMVGTGGALLSGGQKQRIAIARAIVRNPRILLLDEATSALDSESEHIVQAALARAAEGRTTIVVAHRLSTIQGADNIFVLDQGRVIEQGTHLELISKNGQYAELVRFQNLDNQD